MGAVTLLPASRRDNGWVETLEEAQHPDRRRWGHGVAWEGIFGLGLGDAQGHGGALRRTTRTAGGMGLG